MALMYLAMVLTGIILFYFLYTSHFFQFYMHRYRVKSSFLNEFKGSVKGKFTKVAYFAPSHKIISKSEYNSLPNREKVNFSKCYNVITFKSTDVYWELYFHLVKEEITFIEVFNLRAFPIEYKIKSEGNVEKSYSRLNVFTNNHYLTEILEGKANNNLKWLIRKNGDILLIGSNNLHYKAFLDSKKMTHERALDMVKAMNGIKHDIYKKDVLEY